MVKRCSFYCLKEAGMNVPDKALCSWCSEYWNYTPSNSCCHVVFLTLLECSNIYCSSLLSLCYGFLSFPISFLKSNIQKTIPWLYFSLAVSTFQISTMFCYNLRHHWTTTFVYWEWLAGPSVSRSHTYAKDNRQVRWS